MLDVQPLRRLLVDDPSGIDHLSAASGLVQIGNRLHVVADDENSLAVFDLSNDAPGRLVRLFDGELPAQHKARKAAKADLEALVALPAFAGHPHGALMALGSGSRDTRQRAALLPLDAAGILQSPIRQIDMAPLLTPLRATFPDLNIEGAFVSENRLCLLQRGNRGSLANACIGFGWAGIAAWLQSASPAPAPESIIAFELGSIDGVPFGFTDGTALPGGRWLFCAAAEDTSDSYADGACAGSVVGLVNAAGEIERQERLALRCKVEGIAASARPDGLGGIDLLMVTDADDRREPALLLRAAWPMRGGPTA